MLHLHRTKKPPKRSPFVRGGETISPFLPAWGQELYHYIDTIDPVLEDLSHAGDNLRAHLDELYTKRYAITYIACAAQAIIGS